MKTKQTTETAAAGVTHYARMLIKTIDHASAALKQQDPAEALHTFRVNIRRLRTQLAAFSDVISLSRAVKRQLRRLAHCTNEARDVQVAVEILSSLTTSPTAHVPQASLRLYRKEAARCIDKLQAWLPREWAPLRRRLLKQLASCSDNDRAVAYRQASRRQFETHLLALRQFLATITAVQDLEGLHKARILTKQLRYLLEPFADDDALATTIPELVQLQDQLGSIRDLMLLRQRIKAEALKRQNTALSQRFEIRRNKTSLISQPLDNDIALYRYLHALAKREFASLAKTVLGDNAKPFIANLRHANRCLR